MSDDDEIARFFMEAVRAQALIHTGEDICTCGADPDQPTDHHDISCPLALLSAHRGEGQ